MAAVETILSNELELFSRLSKGDQFAFTQIFDHYEPRIYPFILKMTKSESAAEEIVQELFIKLWVDRHSFGSIENPRSYIFRMASNRTISYMRNLTRRVRLVEKSSGVMHVEKNVTQEMVDLRETEEIINKLVEQLPAQQKKVYKLSRQEGLNNEDIARELNISPNTARNHLAEALRFIRDHLQRSPGATIALIVFLVKNAR